MHAHVRAAAVAQVILTTTHLGIVMEYAPGGNALKYVNDFGAHEDRARHIFQQLIAGLDYCHEKASDVPY